ncbi:hypothetical protein OUY22_20915 [Nonomuraea sp. MCN248]|uniref:Uncharacterized protein n=1 Tax=Nonomuraea corallina TaxID=2989783 RepID=A0ABT4SFG9_9ACTN|nr:hypothetical protein [Nonomuraea corallina]MDA0635890.1 hypothetical protein [Nonomuraea corallina]
MGDLLVPDLLHFQTLDDCASAARKAARRFTELGAGYPVKNTDASIFGKLDDSTGLAGLVGQVEDLADTELGHAGKKLEGVERALDKVEQNVRTANKASGAT